jgi:E3 ubiquitin-protein ligase FANCL
LQVALPANYPFVFPQVKCQLPVKIQVSSSSLPQIYSHHQQLIHKYQPLFNCLDDLDQNMKILEPDQPNRSDVWRRIALGYHCSLEIELNPDAPMDAKPKVRFFGNLSRVKDLKNKWANSEWCVKETEKKKDGFPTDTFNRNKDGPIHTNLLSIFQMVKSQESNATEDYTNKHDVECGICYAYKLNDTSTPDIICTNQSCIRGFHYQCLYEVTRLSLMFYDVTDALNSGSEAIPPQLKVSMCYSANVLIVAR